MGVRPEEPTERKVGKLSQLAIVLQGLQALVVIQGFSFQELLGLCLREDFKNLEVVFVGLEEELLVLSHRHDLFRHFLRLVSVF